MDKIRINRIKRKKDGTRTRVDFETLKDNGSWEDAHVGSPDEPRPEFLDALDELAGFVVLACRLRETVKEGLTVTAVSFKYPREVFDETFTVSAHFAADGAIGVQDVSTALRHLSCFDDEAVTLADDATIELLETLKAEAVRYVNGDRKQIKLGRAGEKAA